MPSESAQARKTLKGPWDSGFSVGSSGSTSSVLFRTMCHMGRHVGGTIGFFLLPLLGTRESWGIFVIGARPPFCPQARKFRKLESLIRRIDSGATWRQFWVGMVGTPPDGRSQLCLLCVGAGAFYAGKSPESLAEARNAMGSYLSALSDRAPQVTPGPAPSATK